MAVTGIPPLHREQVTRQLQRLLSSPNLQGSESLCKLLSYLADQAMQQPGIAIKEFQIARDVFGRGDDFDPRLDAIVRVQTGRLRNKLTDYYANAGAQDPVIIEMPKGSYVLGFHLRAPEPKPEPAVTAEHPPESLPAALPAAAPKPPNEWRLNAIFAMVALCVVLLAATLIYMIQPHNTAAVVPPSASAYEPLWKRFVNEAGERPLVVYSNAEFVGRPEVGMRYFDPSRDSHEEIRDHYTGVGEVVAIQELTHTFSLFGHNLRLKRGRLLSLDDVKSNDLIFIGSPSENLSLRELPSPKDFAFQRITEPADRKGDLAIINQHPRPGERTSFLATATLPIREDFGLISLGPGLSPSHWILKLAGITTLGTQAAAEYVCREKNIADLGKRLQTPPGQELPQFEAVLRVKVSGGVPVDSELVAIHKID